MQAISFSRVCLALLLVAACLAQNTDFVGEWTDSSEGGFGGSLFICQNEDPTTISGKYSNVGLIQGTLDYTFRQVTGRFFEGGRSDASCLTGTFDLVLDTNSQSFHGFYVCADDEDQTRIEWNEDRVTALTSSGPIVPTDRQCAKVGVDLGTFDGVWQLFNSTFPTAICVDGDSAQLSFPNFGDEVGVATHEFGSTHNIIYGSYFQVSGFQGSSVWYMDVDGNPVNFFWEGYDYVISREELIFQEGLFDTRLSGRDDTLCNLYDGIRALDWSGTWTDEIFGGEIEVCTVSGEYNAIYTEGGFAFGPVGGFDFEDPAYEYDEYYAYYNYTEYYERLVEDPIVTGSFYEGGDGSCTTGDFEFTLADDGMSFDGCFSCNDDDDGCVHEWNGDRLSRTRPSDSACGRLKPVEEEPTANGKWSARGAQVDFCEDDDEFTASSERVTGFQLFEEGDVSEEGRVAYGIGYSGVQDDARSLYLLAWDNSLLSLFWTDRPNENGINDVGQHLRIAYEFEEEVSEAACSTFSDLKEESYIYIADSPPSSSDASALAAGVGLSIAFVAALL